MSDKSDLECLETLEERPKVEEKPSVDNDGSDDDDIQAIPKSYKKANPETDKRVRGKRERTQAQKDAWARCLAKRAEQRNARKEHLNKVVAEKENASKVRLEKKIVKKAVRVKKNEMVEKLIDEDTDDDDIDEIEVQAIKSFVQQRRAKKRAKRQTTPNPPQAEEQEPRKVPGRAYDFF